jgi:hypothetical protein
MKTIKTLLFLGLLAAIQACNPNDEPALDVNSVNPPDSRFELERFLASGREPMQEFTFDASTPQEIRGEEGTLLRIPANAFVHPSGTPITGTVQVRLREMYSPGDLIFNNAATVSNGQILSSGGSFELEVQQNGQDLRLATNAQIGVQVPTDSVDPNMQLFTARGRDTANQVAWQPQNVAVADTVRDTTGTWGGGLDTLYSFNLNSLFRFINCDYFWNDPRPLTEVKIQVDSAMSYSDTRVLVYLPSVNAMVAVTTFASPYFLINAGYRLPVGINAFFIAIHVDNLGLYHYAIQQNTVSQNHLEVMNFQTITQSQLTTLLQNL